MDLFKSILPHIHKEGYYFIIVFVVVSILTCLMMKSLIFPCLILTCWCVFFFRDPVRVTPLDDNLVISPADGMVVNIEDTLPPPELELGDNMMKKISIFLNVFDVHVNRVPAKGTITKLIYHPGKFFNASLDKASIHNERQTVLMETEDGRNLVFVQIAGLIARRIVCDLEEGNKVEAGERFGIIRFGSRMDVYLPLDVAPSVLVGQKAVGGETVLANLKGNQHKLLGVIRK